MGLHTGDARITNDGVVGLAVHVAARVGATAHGGQVVVSETTVAQAEGSLPDPISVVDLGRHRLRDVPEPMRLFQANHPDLPHEFPELRAGSARTGNLPPALTSFIGREDALADTAALLERSRIVTVTGPGGTGKTRLALEAARRRTSSHRDGVWIVSLADATDATGVAEALRATFGLTARTEESLVEYLGSREVLLLLDNCEQVATACAHFVTLMMEGTDGVRILATSRSPLAVPGEAQLRLGPLQTAGRNAGADAVRASEAARLLVDRVRLHDPHFDVHTDSVADLAALCAHLDGSPLALELVASRVGVLSLHECVERLGNVFGLVGGRGTGRHDTLQATIDWSYRLLSDSERSFVQRIAVFHGGAPLDGVMAVCGDDGLSEWDALDLLGSLTAQSLVTAEPVRGATRYTQLETIRAFCRDRLLESGEEVAVRSRHVRWVSRLCSRLGPRLARPEPGEALRVLASEHDNIGAAFRWAQRAGDCEIQVELTSALGDYLFFAAGGADAREWVRGALRCESPAPEYVDVVTAALVIAFIDAPSEWPAAEALHREAVLRAQTIGDRRRELRAEAVYLGELHRTAELAVLLPEIEAIDDPPQVATAIGYLATALRRQGRPAEADVYLARARALREDVGLQLPYVEYQSAMVQLEMGRQDVARRLLEESLAGRVSSGDSTCTSFTLSRLGVMARERGDVQEALRLLGDAEDLERRTGWNANVAVILADLASARALAGDVDGAAGAAAEAARMGAPFGAYSMAAVELALGDVARAQGRAEAARTHYERSRALAGETHFRASTEFADKRLAAMASARN